MVFRIWLTLSHDGYLGVDGGAYLLGVNAVLGDEPTGAGFPRPPLAPGWLLVPFTSLLGIDVGYKVWSSIASVLPAIPVYLLARRICREYSPTPAIFAAGFLLLDLLHAEMLVTGALPLIGFALLGMVWWAMGELVEEWSLPKAVVLAVCLGLIPWVNQTTAGLAIVTIPVYSAALVWFNSKQQLSPDSPESRGAMPTARTALLRLTPPLFIGGILALAALPWYMKVLPVSGVLNYPGPVIFFTYWGDSAWFQFFLAIPLGIYLILKANEPWLRSMGVLMILLGTLLLFLSTDETIINVFYRSRYLLAIPVYVGLSWCVFTRWLPQMPGMARKAACALAVAVAGLMAVGYVSQFDRQTDYSDMATPATVRALAMLDGDPNAGIINNSFTLALWISALNKVQSPHTWTWPPPPTWTETDKDVRCVLGWVDDCNYRAATERLGVEYVLIDTRFPYYNARAPGIYMAPDDQWAVTAKTPWLTKVFDEDTTIVWRIAVPPMQ